MAQAVHRNAERLHRTIADLLNVAEAVRGTMVPVLSPLAVLPVLREVLASLQPMAEA